MLFIMHEHGYFEILTQLNKIENEVICEAQLWIYQELLGYLDIKGDTAINTLLSGKNLDKSHQDFFNRYATGKTSASRFRNDCCRVNSSLKLKNFRELVAFYWTAIQLQFPKVVLAVNAEARHQVYIYLKESDVKYPNMNEEESKKYIGFYARSKDDKSDKIGVIELEMTCTNSRIENKVGDFYMKAYYKNYTIGLPGKFYENNKTIFFRTRKNHQGDHEVENNYVTEKELKEKEVLSQIIIHKSPDKNKTYLLGIMNSINRQFDFAFAVSIVFIPREEFISIYNDNKPLTKADFIAMASDVNRIPNSFAYFLFGQRISTNFDDYLEYNHQKLPFENQVKALENIAGRYLVHKLQRTSKQGLFMDYSILEILPNGIVMVDQIRENTNGYIRYINTTSATGKKNLMLYLGIDEGKLYQQQMICLESDETSNDRLKGVYLIGGNEDPLIGKILLTRVSSTYKLPKAEAFIPSLFTWSHDRSIETKFFESDKQFMPGYKIDLAQEKIKLPAYLPTELSVYCITKNEASSQEETNFTHRKPKILRLDLKLGDSTFKMAKNDSEFINGPIQYQNGKLVLTAKGSNEFEVFHFALQSVLEKKFEFSHTFGVMSLFLNSGNPESRVAILTPKFQKEEGAFEIFDEEDVFRILAEEQPINTAKTIAFSYLMGTEINRIIRVSKSLNKMTHVRSILYRRLYFYSAVALINGLHEIKDVTTLNAEILNLMQMAKYQGFMQAKLTSEKEADVEMELLKEALKKVMDKKFKAEILEMLH